MIKFPLLLLSSRSPGTLLAIGLFCTILGIRQFYKVYHGDTLILKHALGKLKNAASID